MKRKSTDRHHILWYRRDYNKGYAKQLREHWYCSVEVPRETLHKKIHYEIAHIPVPRGSSIKSVLYQLELLQEYGAIHDKDPIDIRLMVLCSLFRCIEPKTYEALKKQYDIVCEFYNKKAPD